MEEKFTIIRPSQWANIVWIWVGIVGLILTFTISYWCIIPVSYCLWKVIELACWRYEIQEDGDTIIEQRGVFTTYRVEINYFRIKSIRIEKNIYFRFIGLSNIQILTSEPFKPALLLYAVSNGDNIANFLKEMSIVWRNKKGVHETDFHSF
jgi:uncharacterized membrane protein YdbT with pleckstrin-like domain